MCSSGSSSSSGCSSSSCSSSSSISVLISITIIRTLQITIHDIIWQHVIMLEVTREATGSSCCWSCVDKHLYSFHYIWCWNSLAIEWTPILLYSLMGARVIGPPLSTDAYFGPFPAYVSQRRHDDNNVIITLKRHRLKLRVLTFIISLSKPLLNFDFCLYIWNIVEHFLWYSPSKWNTFHGALKSNYLLTEQSM